ncbi:HD domain-containing protein [Aquimarina addita]|uniref:HD domain-containing protein n=1 Tax=Aquimarina addita TaxID=870485 RepID=A0ABP6UUG7_9FLAO
MSKKWSIDELQDIWQLASNFHNGQKYGGHDKDQQIEYINHIGSVTFEILKAIEIDTKLDSDLCIKCAVLHDTIEDTKLTIEEVEYRFGKDVAEGVLALTKKEQDDSVKDKMLDSLARIKQQPKEVWAVKMADRICNLYAPPFYWSNEKKKAYLKEAEVIYNELKAGSSYLANRLQDKMNTYNSFIDE